MNRKIKFRAWAVASKEMFYPETSDGWELRDGELDLLPNTILMQFTGLKDKNGKEIYEGDIIVRKDDKYYYSVHYGTTSFGISQHRDGNLFASSFVFISDSHNNLVESGEVIGNIYEKSEELKNDRGDDSAKYEGDSKNN